MGTGEWLKLMSVVCLKCGKAGQCEIETRGAKVRWGKSHRVHCLACGETFSDLNLTVWIGSDGTIYQPDYEAQYAEIEAKRPTEKEGVSGNV